MVDISGPKESDIAFPRPEISISHEGKVNTIYFPCYMTIANDIVRTPLDKIALHFWRSAVFSRHVDCRAMINEEPAN
jgi:hypothetical protein